MNDLENKEDRTERILRPGENCSCLAEADKVSFLIDADAYFRAFRSAAIKAEKTIYIEAWDIYSREKLMPEEPDDGYPAPLGDFLNQLTKEKKKLRVYILLWDFAMLFGMKREWFPIYRLGWKSHRHISIEVDGLHPIGASHHQKTVVIDDRVAFVGGIDFTKERWDTPAHNAVDQRREKMDGIQCRPNHEIQIAVAGEIAGFLGQYFRERWHRVTDEKLAEPRDFSGPSPWPEKVGIDIRRCRVGVARTRGVYKDVSQIKEVEQLYIDSIAAAKETVYIENQYFTAQKVVEAMAARLQEKDSPEIVIILPRQTDGWLSQYTMDTLRNLSFKKLYQADRFHKLKIYYPFRKGLPDEKAINVHSKLMIADNSFVRIGSSNLNNRSMGLDSECDLAIEAEGEEAIENKIAALRNRLLAEHLGIDAHVVDETVKEKKSLIRAIESLCGGDRTLRPLEPEDTEAIELLMEQQNILDPEEPIDPEKIIEDMIQEEKNKNGHLRLVGFAVFVLVCLGFAILWQTTSIKELFSVERLSSYGEWVRNSRFTLFYVGGIYIVGGLIMAPITLLLILTFLVFGPWVGMGYALAGVCCNAAVTYWLGYFAGRTAVRRLAGKRLNRLSRKMGRRGILSTSIIRLVPFAPFTIVNLVAGASHIRFFDFLAGTLIGILPGMLALAGLLDRGLALLANPEVMTIAGLVAVLVVVIGAFFIIRKLRAGDEETATVNKKQP